MIRDVAITVIDCIIINIIIIIICSSIQTQRCILNDHQYYQPGVIALMTILVLGPFYIY